MDDDVQIVDGAGTQDATMADATEGNAESLASSGQDSGSTTYQWKVPNFSELTEKLYSEVFEINGYKWRLLLFPSGNNGMPYLSLFLDVADNSSYPHSYMREANFTLLVRSQIDPSIIVKKDTEHRFNKNETDWGFNQFIPLKDLQDPEKGFVINDSIIVEAQIHSQREINPYQPYDSKKETGFVGVKNQGATCYMNSLLQTLYHLPYFRKAVYHIPTMDTEAASASIPLALQSLFYKLQFNDTSAATKDLTRSFGWDAYDSFMQHDILEFNNVLCDKLEEKMKSTEVEGTIEKLFEASFLNYIECVNVDCKSERKENFRDLQLVVKGCKDIYASFDKFCEVEMLDGDNKYSAEGHGLQDAKKGISFIDFPPVLELQLKRFEYDFLRDQMTKVNDRYEFPLDLDLDANGGKYFAANAVGRKRRNKYKLHSVLVHSGGVNGGHYYAFIRPDVRSDQWYKFDDDKVTKEDVKTAVFDQYGEDEVTGDTVRNPVNRFGKYSNAYMLVYVREDDIDTVFCSVQESDIAMHLRMRFKEEQEEKERKKKEKLESHLYTVVKVATELDMKNQIGQTTMFDLVDHEHVKHFRIEKKLSFTEFKQKMQMEFNIPVASQRYWTWVKRQNQTFRPSKPLTLDEENSTIGDIRENRDGGRYGGSELKLFLEEVALEHMNGALPKPLEKDEIIIFFKLFSPETKTLQYTGKLFVNSGSVVGEIRSKLIEMGRKYSRLSGWETNQILVFEEIKYDPVMIEPLKWNASFSTAQLENGDIISFQQEVPQTVAVDCRTVPDFMKYVRNKEEVKFRKLENARSQAHDSDITVELSKLSTYDEIVSALGDRLRVNPLNIRLTAHNSYTGVPKPQAVKFRGIEKLSDLLTNFQHKTDLIYYEVLEMSLSEFEQLKMLKIEFHSDGKVTSHQLQLPKQSTVEQALTNLRSILPNSDKLRQLRLLEVFYSKIYKIFSHDELIESINDQYWTVRAEEVGAEELDMSANDKLLHFYHMSKESTGSINNFGDPLLLCVREGETFAQVKGRLQTKLNVLDKDFASWKFFWVTSSSKCEALEDEEELLCRFQTKKDHQWEQYVGMEHVDNAPRRNNNSGRFSHEKPIKIYT